MMVMMCCKLRGRFLVKVRRLNLRMAVIERDLVTIFFICTYIQMDGRTDRWVVVG